MRNATPAVSAVMSIEHFLAGLNRRTEVHTDSIMRAAGWCLVSTLRVDLTDPAAAESARSVIDSAIVAAWPATVRLTCAEAACVLSLWHHPNPLPANPDAAPFPTSLDLEYALHVLNAVGAARADRANDEIAGLSDGAAGRQAISILERQVMDDQIAFEHVVAALRAFARG